jgi:hypothetical protein
MTEEQEANLEQNIQAAVLLMASKYRTGQAEHSGNLWEKSGMLRNAENEVADLNHYLPTIRLQVGKALSAIHQGDTQEAGRILEKLLSPTCG